MEHTHHIYEAVFAAADLQDATVDELMDENGGLEAHEALVVTHTHDYDPRENHTHSPDPLVYGTYIEAGQTEE